MWMITTPSSAATTGSTHPTSCPPSQGLHTHVIHAHTPATAALLQRSSGHGGGGARLACLAALPSLLVLPGPARGIPPHEVLAQAAQGRVLGTLGHLCLVCLAGRGHNGHLQVGARAYVVMTMWHMLQVLPAVNTEMGLMTTTDQVGPAASPWQSSCTSSTMAAATHPLPQKLHSLPVDEHSHALGLEAVAQQRAQASLLVACCALAAALGHQVGVKVAPVLWVVHQD